MTRDDLLELVRDRMGFNRNFDEKIVYRHLDKVQETYEQNTTMPLPWFLFNAGTTEVTVADTRTIALPTDFLDFHEDWDLTATDADGKLHKMKRLKDRQLSTDQRAGGGMPTHFDLQATTLALYPLPDAVYTITIPHFARSTALSTVTTSDWLTEFGPLMVEEVLFSLFTSTRDRDGLRLLDLQSLRSKYLARVEARNHSLSETVMNSQ